MSSSLSIEAAQTDAIIDNGTYYCQVNLIIAGVDNVSVVSNTSRVAFRSKFACFITKKHNMTV